MRDRTSDTAHRAAAERTLGRKLRQGEVVDHRNEDKADQSPTNLAVTTRGAHTTAHNKARPLSALRRALRAFREGRKAY